MGRTEFPDLNRLRASLGWYDKGKTFNESEKALVGAQGLVRSKKCLTPPTLLEMGFFNNNPLENAANSTAFIDLPPSQT